MQLNTFISLVSKKKKPYNTSDDLTYSGPKANIVWLGDSRSVLGGQNSDGTGGTSVPDMITALLPATKYNAIVNNSAGGRTTQLAIDYPLSTMISGDVDGSAFLNLLVVSLGTNDAAVDIRSTANYKANLTTIVSAAKGYGFDKVLLVLIGGPFNNPGPYPGGPDYNDQCPLWDEYSPMINTQYLDIGADAVYNFRSDPYLGKFTWDNAYPYWTWGNPPSALGSGGSGLYDREHEGMAGYERQATLLLPKIRTVVGL